MFTGKFFGVPTVFPIQFSNNYYVILEQSSTNHYQKPLLVFSINMHTIHIVKKKHTFEHPPSG